MMKEGQVGNVGAMAQSRDNPLSEIGIDQAKTLRGKVEAVASDPSTGTSGEVRFLEANTVWMSPLTRAVQTGLIGAAPACERIGKVRLVPNAREKRNLGGLDTSGQEIGEDVMRRVYTCTCEAGLLKDDVKQLCKQNFDFSEVQLWKENMES